MDNVPRDPDHYPQARFVYSKTAVAFSAGTTLALVIVSVLAIAVPAFALNGTVDASCGNVPGGSVRYYSGYNSTVSTSGLTHKGNKSDGTALTVTIKNDHWYQFTQNGHYRYILREFVRVSGKEWEIRYGTMELNPGCSWTRYVKKLQTDLKTLKYYDGRIDGGYGDATREAVKAFQSANGLSSDGRCGPLTKAALYSAI